MIERLTKILNTCSIIILISTSIMLFSLWYQAWSLGIVPEKWGEKMGNHGPWRHIYSLRYELLNTFFLACISVPVSFLSLLLKPRWQTLGLVIFCLFVAIGLFRSHYWLID